MTGIVGMIVQYMERHGYEFLFNVPLTVQKVSKKTVTFS